MKRLADIGIGKGAIARFDPETEAELVAVADAENYPLITQPIEVLVQFGGTRSVCLYRN